MRYLVPCTRSFFRLLKKLSIGALSQQLPLRFHFHFTPLHASWVNQIELWFARYTRRVLLHTSHTSTAHLRERTERFVSEHNQVARPFKWSFRGYPLQGGAS
ncbi:hypothetical protein WK54_18155 [Burkholderia ubonensis]|nr:hypothetical protein WK54_18155 [Burkholderia ubonensis]